MFHFESQCHIINYSLDLILKSYNHKIFKIVKKSIENAYQIMLSL